MNSLSFTSGTTADVAVEKGPGKFRCQTLICKRLFRFCQISDDKMPVGRLGFHVCGRQRQHGKWLVDNQRTGVCGLTLGVGLFVPMCVCVFVWESKCVSVKESECACLCVCKREWVWVCACVFVCVCVHTLHQQGGLNQVNVCAHPWAQTNT